MNKEQLVPKVEGIAIAVVKEQTLGAEPEWIAYFLNLKKAAIFNILISSNGYGERDGERIITSTLRRFIQKIEGQSYVKVEILQEEVLGLTNEFWVSFYQDTILYDKKYVFLAESLLEENFINIPLIEKQGVMIA